MDKPDPSPSGASAANTRSATPAAPQFNCDVEPHLRTKDETEELFPLLEMLADGLCQTQSFILNELARAGLTVVLLDPHAREVVPDAAAAPRQPEGPDEPMEASMFTIGAHVVMDLAAANTTAAMITPLDQILAAQPQARAQSADAATLGPERETLVRSALEVAAAERRVQAALVMPQDTSAQICAHVDAFRAALKDKFAAEKEVLRLALAFPEKQPPPVPDALRDEALGALRAFVDAGCACDPREIEGGHRVDCRYVELAAAARAVLRRSGRHEA